MKKKQRRQIMMTVLSITLATLANPVLGFAEEDHDHSNHDQRTNPQKKKVNSTHSSHDHDDHDKDKKKSKQDSHAHDEDDESEEGHDHESETSHNETEKGHVHEEEGEEDASSSVGPEKALMSVRKHGKEFQISSEANKTLNLKTDKPRFEESSKSWKIPYSALVSHQEEYSVYRIGDKNWIQSITVSAVKVGRNFAWIKGPLQASDNVVINGAPFLRLAELEASGKGGEGHAH